jgi:signal transduction histidine kinase
MRSLRTGIHRGSCGPAWLVDIGLLLVVAAARLVQYGLDDDDHHPPVGLALVVLIVVLSAVPLIFRRQFPAGALLAVGAGELALLVLDLHGVPLALLIAIYGVAESSDQRRSITRLILALILTTLAVAVFIETPSLVLMVGLSLVMAWSLGALQSARARLAVETERRVELLERERETQAHLAVTDERARIARELHDVVAHGVSVMTMHAAGARLALNDDPDRADEAMAEVERTGRRSLTELRRLLGLLDRGVESADLAPQPGLARLDDLVAEFRRAELPVDLEIDGEPRELPSGVDLSAFRIIQEALTNVLKHAGHVPVTVTLRYRNVGLGIEVVNPTNGDRPDGAGAGAGRGLVGMRERVALHRGRFVAGPEPDGRFRVDCELPLTAP